MKKSYGLWCLWGFAFASFGGTILHFLYDWTNKATWASFFSGVNESTWEHMKLLFFPMFVFAVFQSFFFPKRQDFWCIKLRGTLLGLVLIPVIFYTYNGAIGKSTDFINISIFFVSALIAYIYECKQLKKENTACSRPTLSFFILLAIGALFVIFTFYTPTLNIFKDPLTNTYGI